MDTDDNKVQLIHQLMTTLKSTKMKLLLSKSKLGGSIPSYFLLLLKMNTAQVKLQ